MERPAVVPFLAILTWGVGTSLLVWRRGIPFEREQVMAICLAGLVAAGIDARRTWRRLLRDWVPVAIALAAYDYTRGAADMIGRPVLVRWPADADRALFGEVPTVWLQQHVDPRPWLAVAFSLVYASHFVAPFAVAAQLWWRDHALWARWRRRFLSVTGVALLVFLVVPVAPPWVAAQVGVIDPVGRNAGNGWSLLGIQVADDVISHGQATTNLYAAMPSLHAAYALVTVIALLPLLSRAGRVVAFAYPVAMGVTLVATGEHYVVDIVAGFILVAFVEMAWRQLERRTPGTGSDAPLPTASAPATRRAVPTWLAPIGLPLLVAAVTRAWRLGLPSVLTYDEVFYVNDAADLVLDGHQAGALHPPFSKLLMAPTIGLFGFQPVAWRTPVLLTGLAAVALTGAGAWLATGSRRLTALAASLVTLDGLAFVTGRLGLLEAGATLCVAAMMLGLIVVHRPGGWADTGQHPWGPPAVIAAAGCGAAAKWAVMPAAIVAVTFLVGPLRQRWRLRASAAVATIASGALLAMVVSWGPAAWSGGWVPTGTASPLATIAADSAEMAAAHLSLDRDGPGHAPAWTWVTQNRPTVVFAKECRGHVGATDGVCRPGSAMTARILAAGNPAVWLAGSTTLAFLAVTAWRQRRRPRARLARVTLAVAASLWVPWLVPGARPYSFYGAVLVPVLALSVAQTLDGRRRRASMSVVLGCAAAMWFVYRYPDLTALV